VKTLWEKFLWAIKGWVLPVFSLVILIVPMYLLGYTWLAFTFAGFAAILGILELLAMRETGTTVSGNTANQIKKNPATLRIIAFCYFLFSLAIAVHFYAIAFY